MNKKLENEVKAGDNKSTLNHLLMNGYLKEEADCKELLSKFRRCQTEIMLKKRLNRTRRDKRKLERLDNN